MEVYQESSCSNKQQGVGFKDFVNVVIELKRNGQDLVIKRYKYVLFGEVGNFECRRFKPWEI